MNIKNPIINELETLAPTLISVPRTIPYSLKNGYLESLSIQILEKIKSGTDVTGLFSIYYLKKIIPYIVPENYFLVLADEVLAKISLQKNEIHESLIPVLPKNPYQAPTGYFDNLAAEIFKKINFVTQSETFFIDKFNKITPYQVPVGYFDNFSIHLLNKIEHINEGLQKGSYFTKSNPYQVPVGFFDNLPTSILNNIKESGELVISAGFSKANPYQVPVGYFETLADEVLLKANPPIRQHVPLGYFAALPNIILQKIRGLEVESELAEIAPLLNTINKTPIYQVPIGYFDEFQTVAPQVQTVAAKVIGIKRKVNWFKNAIAACLIGTLGFTAYQILDSGTTKETVKTIQSVAQDENQVSVPTADINVDEELSKVDDTSLTKYMNNIEMPTEQTTAHFQDVNSGDVDAALQDIPDDVIQQHLEDNGELSNKKN
jgi:hypothetical protein